MRAGFGASFGVLHKGSFADNRPPLACAEGTQPGRGFPLRRRRLGRQKRKHRDAKHRKIKLTPHASSVAEPIALCAVLSQSHHRPFVQVPRWPCTTRTAGPRFIFAEGDEAPANSRREPHRFLIQRTQAVRKSCAMFKSSNGGSGRNI